MEMSDGIDFYEWNATVRALTEAVRRLDETVERLIGLAGSDRLAAQLEERQLRLRHWEEAVLWLPQPSTALPVAPATPPVDAASVWDPSRADVKADAEDDDGDAGAEGWEDTAVVHPSPSGSTPARADDPPAPKVRFGDPEAIRLYGRPLRRR